MNDGLTDKQLTERAWIAREMQRIERNNDLVALRARVAEMETTQEEMREAILTQNGVVVSGTLKLKEARARVAKLEAEFSEVSSREREACAAIVEAEAERHEQALREFPDDDAGDEHIMHLSSAMDMRSLAGAIRARKP